MKKIIFILLILPLSLFAQSEEDYRVYSSVVNRYYESESSVTKFVDITIEKAYIDGRHIIPPHYLEKITELYFKEFTTFIHPDTLANEVKSLVASGVLPASVLENRKFDSIPPSAIPFDIFADMVKQLAATEEEPVSWEKDKFELDQPLTLYIVNTEWFSKVKKKGGFKSLEEFNKRYANSLGLYTFSKVVYSDRYALASLIIRKLVGGHHFAYLVLLKKNEMGTDWGNVRLALFWVDP